MKAVVLAAGKGTRLAPLTDARPKPLVEVGGRPLLFRALDHLAAVGIAGGDVIVVGGFRIDVLAAALAAGGFEAVQVVENPRYAELGNFHSLLCARAAIGGDGFLQLDGDVLFDGALLPRLLEAPGPAVLAVDVRADLDAETMKAELDAEGRVVALAKTLAGGAGESIGIARVDAPFADEVMAELATLEPAGLGHEYYERAYEQLAQRGRGPFRIVDVSDLLVTEIDDLADLGRAEALLRARAVA